MNNAPPALNPTIFIQDEGADVGPRRGVNLGTGITITADDAGVITVEAEGGAARQTVLTEPGSFTVSAAQEGALIRVGAGGTITLPSGLPVGFFVDVEAESAAQTGFLAFPPASSISRGDRTVLNGQYARARAQVVATNVWLLDGDLTTGG